MKRNIRSAILVAFGIALPGLFCSTCAQSSAANASIAGSPAASPIRVNQLGYYPHAPKIAVVISTNDSNQLFYLLSLHSAHDVARTIQDAADTTHGSPDTVYTGRLGLPRHSTNAALTTRIADFSTFLNEGLYEIAIPDIGVSYPFRIGPHMALPVARASLKGYYYQRSAMALDPVYAGQWSRPAGHPDTTVLIHPSAASGQRPAGTVISAPGGWYDAGDYNKYIVNSGITMGTLLSAYEDFPDYYDTLHTNIPPIANLPDILNEAIYNLRWMVTMQDPADGGVYHKCTNAAFDEMVMPGVTKKARYVVQKGTAATLDFAAVMAQAARILRKFSTQLPGLSDSCLRAATGAWRWAINHPALAYEQDAMNKSFGPKITTGDYGDRNFKDEWYWAAVELMVTMPSEPYKKIIEERIGDSAGLPSWSNVHMLGDYTLLRRHNRLPKEWQPAINKVLAHLLQMADAYSAREQQSAFLTVMGGSPRDFIWGSNAVAANQGILLINAWLQTKDRKYIDGALSNLDYLLGRNATGYCFVTGMGSYSPMHPHHRPSVSDGIVAPVPGLLAGGPNPGRQDHQKYNYTERETAYLDQDQAYASNEIAINWNAPLVYLAGALEALRDDVGY